MNSRTRNWRKITLVAPRYTSSGEFCVCKRDWKDCNLLFMMFSCCWMLPTGFEACVVLALALPACLLSSICPSMQDSVILHKISIHVYLYRYFYQYKDVSKALCYHDPFNISVIVMHLPLSPVKMSSDKVTDQNPPLYIEWFQSGIIRHTWCSCTVPCCIFFQLKTVTENLLILLGYIYMIMFYL